MGRASHSNQFNAQLVWKNCYSWEGKKVVAGGKCLVAWKTITMPSRVVVWESGTYTHTIKRYFLWTTSKEEHIEFRTDNFLWTTSDLLQFTICTKQVNIDFSNTNNNVVTEHLSRMSQSNIYMNCLKSLTSIFCFFRNLWILMLVTNTMRMFKEKLKNFIKYLKKNSAIILVSCKLRTFIWVRAPKTWRRGWNCQKPCKSNCFWTAPFIGSHYCW